MPSLSPHQRNAATAERLRPSMQAEGATLNGLRVWTRAELAQVWEYFPDREALTRLLPHRTWHAIRHQAGRLGLTRPKRAWTAAEVSRLGRLYSTGTKEEITRAFPGRAWDAIASTARRHGFRRDRKPYTTIGVIALDALRQKCFERNMVMRDLDELVGSKGYFRKASWIASGRIDFGTVVKAIEALGGKVGAVWSEELEL